MNRMNRDVPVETLFRHKCRETNKLKKRVAKLEATIEQLRNNITLILKDPAVKKQVAVDARVHESKQIIATLEKRLHEAKETNNRLLTRLIQQNEQQKDL